MGKEGALWDDSALVKAFDDAMSEYKKMHSKKKSNANDDSIDKEKQVTSNGDGEVSGSAPFNGNENRQLISTREMEGTKNILSNTNAEVKEAQDLNSVKEDAWVDSHVPEPCKDSSNGLAAQDAVEAYSCSQGAEGYNQLLSQYYELEGKKQQILQQLHQYSGGNCQYYGETSNSGAQGSCSTSQEHPIPASQAPYPTAVCTCCPYGCQFFVAPCMADPACSSGAIGTYKTCTDTYVTASSRKSPSLVNNDIVKTAMGAMDKAISSMKAKASINTDVEKSKENEAEMHSVSSETDLTDVLNAWYSAGFYTGKYLTEQSMAKNQRQ